MGELTNGEFIRQKLTNFIKYCRENVGKRCTGNVLVNYTKKLDELAVVEIIHFTQYVAMEMAPYKNNERMYLIRMMEGSGVQWADIGVDEQNNLIIYIQCFVAVVST